jgi:prevent-host-death family protein
MATVSIAEAKDQLSRLIDQALAGEKITITRYGKPMVTLTPEPANQPRKMTGPEMVAWLREELKDMPKFKDTGADIIRQMRDEGY